MHTNVNVVIPAYKPDEKLAQIVKKLSEQTVLVSKVIIMNTEESFWNKEIDSVGAMKVEVHHISKDEFDHGKTRNDGISYADEDCDFIVLMTQDAIPYDDKLIENLISQFKDERVAASYARQVAADTSSLAEKFTRSFNYPDEDRIKKLEDIETIGIKAFFCSNVCAAYRKDVFDKLGGFVNKAIFNEDMVYANKLLKNGYFIAYASKAKVIHTHEYSGMQQYKRNFDLAVSQKMNPDVFEGISSESEGLKYVIAALKYFCKNKRPLLIIPFGINCVYKYAGYRKGKKYESLSRKELLKCSSNPGFFEKEV